MEDLFSLSLTPIMYLLLFTYVFGGAISGNTHTYLQQALPGILVLSVVFATMGTGMMLNADITTGVFDRFRSLPIARWAPLAGAIMGDAIRYVISIAVTLGFGFILGFRITATPFSAAMGCLLLLVFALAMCWFSALIGVLMKSPQAVQGFGYLLMFPIVFGSNLLVPTSTMPGWLQAFVKVNPVTYLSEAERALLTGGAAGPWWCGRCCGPSASSSSSPRSRSRCTAAGPDRRTEPVSPGRKFKIALIERTRPTLQAP